MDLQSVITDSQSVITDSQSVITDSQSVITDSQSVITDSQKGPLEGAIFRSLCLSVSTPIGGILHFDGGPAIYTSHASINRV